MLRAKDKVMNECCRVEARVQGRVFVCDGIASLASVVLTTWCLAWQDIVSD